MTTRTCLLALALLLPLPAQAEESPTMLAQKLVDLLNPPQEASLAAKGDALLVQTVDLQIRAKTLGIMLSDQQKAALTTLSGRLSGWIEAARARGELRAGLPTQVVLLSLYARTCDPAIDYLRLGGSMDDDAIVEAMLALFFDGVAAPGPA